jgi:hypothetical protein
VSERADGVNVSWRTADHAACLLADCVHLAGPIVDGHDRWLEHDYTASALIDDRVRRAQIDRQLTLRPGATQSLPTPSNHLPPTVSVISVWWRRTES